MDEFRRNGVKKGREIAIWEGDGKGVGGCCRFVNECGCRRCVVSGPIRARLAPRFSLLAPRSSLLLSSPPAATTSPFKKSLDKSLLTLSLVLLLLLLLLALLTISPTTREVNLPSRPPGSSNSIIPKWLPRLSVAPVPAVRPVSVPIPIPVLVAIPSLGLRLSRSLFLLLEGGLRVEIRVGLLLWWSLLLLLLLLDRPRHRESSRRSRIGSLNTHLLSAGGGIVDAGSDVERSIDDGRDGLNFRSEFLLDSVEVESIFVRNQVDR